MEMIYIRLSGGDAFDKLMYNSYGLNFVAWNT